MIRDDVTLEVSHRPYKCVHWAGDDDAGGSHPSRWWIVTLNGYTVMGMSECSIKWHQALIRDGESFPDAVTPLVTGHPDWDPAPPPEFGRAAACESRGAGVGSAAGQDAASK